MKIKSFLAMVLVAGCTAKTPETKVATPVSEREKVNSVSSKSVDASSSVPELILVPEVEGFDVNFGTIEKSGSFFRATELTILESESSHILDSFEAPIWGPLTVEFQAKSIQVHFDSEDTPVLKLLYHNPGREVTQKNGVCVWKKPIESEEAYHKILSDDAVKSGDWETLVSKLSHLAATGNQKAFQFFMNPSKKQKAYYQFLDGAASPKAVQARLRFLSANGCSWQS